MGLRQPGHPSEAERRLHIQRPVLHYNADQWQRFAPHQSGGTRGRRHGVSDQLVYSNVDVVGTVHDPLYDERSDSGGSAVRLEARVDGLVSTLYVDHMHHAPTSRGVFG